MNNYKILLKNLKSELKSYEELLKILKIDNANTNLRGNTITIIFSLKEMIKNLELYNCSKKGGK